MNIGSCVSWYQLLKLIKDESLLGIKSDFKTLYEIVDGKKIIVKNITVLKEDGWYYVETEDDAPKFSNEMISFFDKLKSEQELEDDEVKIIKGVFAYQKIKFKNLNKTTDEKLKEDGIKERGLRDAILAVTENL